MKKILALLFILFTIKGFAEKVPIDTAILVATNQFDMWFPDVPHLLDRVESERLDKDTSYYIVCFKDSGYFIVSNEDQVRPILGYSFSNIYDKKKPIPPALNWWMNRYKNKIKKVSDNKIKNSKANKQWKDLKKGSRFKNKSFNYVIGVKLLITPDGAIKWGQSGNNSYNCTNNIYNKYVPGCDDCDCDHYDLGCGAVAMAQIMWYWRFPPHLAFGHGYDWEIMPSEVYDYTNTTHANEVAKLIYDCAEESDMVYWESGSWTTLDEVQEALFSMGFFSEQHDRFWYFDETWSNMLKVEINAGRPVLLKGGGMDFWDQHYFICDGYNSQGAFSFNWGWKGFHNGDWYNDIDDIEPEDEDYSDGMYMLDNILPLCSCIEEDLSNVGYNNIVSGGFIHEQARISISLPSSGNQLNIEPGAKLRYTAKSSIILKPGFWAKPGSDFQTIFRECGSNRQSVVSVMKSAPIVNTGQEELTTKTITTSNKEDQIYITPNPGNGNYIINNLPSGILQLAVYSVTGNLMYSEISNVGRFHSINITNLRNGVYFVTGTINDKSFVVKLLKQ
jgi:hypothetical protein